MNTTASSSRSRRLSSQKPSELRTASVNPRRSPSLLLQSSINQTVGSRESSAPRASFSPIKERPRKSSVNKDKVPPIKSKTLLTGLKSQKEPNSKSPKVSIDVKGPHSLSKSEAERFSPYVAPKREGEVRKEIFVSTLKRSDLSKPKSYASIAENLASKSATNVKEPEYFTFALGKGNNDKAIRTVLAKRCWWKETYATNSVFNLTWHQTNKPINFGALGSGKVAKRVANHFEFNREIGVKSNLLKNLQSYCERNSLELFKITPMTFTLDLMSHQFAADMKNFKKYFKQFDRNPEDPAKSQEELKSSLVDQEKIPLAKSKTAQEPVQTLSKGKLPDTYYSGCNLWLLKPIDFNRGRGINLFNKLSTLEHYLKCFKNGEDQPDQKGSSSPVKTDASAMNIVKSHKFVVQKYIEKPLLLNNRKFDVRVWVLIDQDMNLYCFKEGYIRLSSEAFSLDERTIEDKYVHLTNNAVQKYSKNYGKHESGNIISLRDLEAHLPKESASASFTKIKDRMKELIKISMESVKNKLNAAERKHCFEVFGYDFILDSELNVWIIEVNSNPSIDESNGLLRSLVPRMLDDTFKLTIDKILQPTKKNYKPEDLLKEEANVEFKVDGYRNDENLWEHLACLRKNQSPKKEKQI